MLLYGSRSSFAYNTPDTKNLNQMYKEVAEEMLPLGLDPDGAAIFCQRVCQGNQRIVFDT